ncbi:MAG: hypothetical protein ACRD8O_21500 [Bryobacteraceae bacterium]
MRPLLVGVAAITLAAQGPRPELPPSQRLGAYILSPGMERLGDVLKRAPKQYTLDLDNDLVRVVRVKLGPGESGPMHDDSAATLVCLTECHIRLERPDGKVQDVHMEAGQTRWVWNDTRAERNLSTKPVEMLFIEMKPARTPGAPR